MSEAALLKPDSSFILRLQSAGGEDLKRCYQCATCTTVCDLSPEDHPFPRKELLYAQWGWKDKLLTDPDIWLCHQCNDCTARCPRGVKPGNVLAAMRNFAFEHFAIPGFMGKALVRPVGLIPLLLVPILIIGSLMWQNTGGDLAPLMSASVVDFGNFIPHGTVEQLFIIGNILIFAFAAIGMMRFWNGLQSNVTPAQRKAFIPSAISTALTILSHKRFGQCTAAKYRKTAHLLVLFGFISALIATAGAVIALVIEKFVPSFPHEYHVWITVPFPLWHPIKIFGNIGGFSILIGLGIIVKQRLTNEKNSGKATYSLWLFIWMTAIVAATGLGSQFLRIANVPSLAYPVYFIHLVAVFFLLWYAPYSQMGHMFYRTLAMVYATSIGRKGKEISG